MVFLEGIEEIHVPNRCWLGAACWQARFATGVKPQRARRRGMMRPSTVLVVLVAYRLLNSLIVHAACTPAIYTACPLAAVAAGALTGHSPLILITNAHYTATWCTTAPKQSVALVTSWGLLPCHYLGATMPLGTLWKRCIDTADPASSLALDWQTRSHILVVACIVLIHQTAHVVSACSLNQFMSHLIPSSHKSASPALNINTLTDKQEW